MLTITKRSGKEEGFVLNKILNSMVNAGISQDTAEKITDGIKYHEGMTTNEIRNRVIGGIKNREPQAAKQFESYPKKIHKT